MWGLVMSDCKQEYVAWSSKDGCYCGEYEDGSLFSSDARNELSGWVAAWNHQQAKIDLLVNEIVETEEFLNKQNHIKQVKIDEALTWLTRTDIRAINMAREILQGGDLKNLRGEL